jgi:hypothetical protein
MVHHETFSRNNSQRRETQHRLSKKANGNISQLRHVMHSKRPLKNKIQLANVLHDLGAYAQLNFG